MQNMHLLIYKNTGVFKGQIDVGESLYGVEVNVQDCDIIDWTNTLGKGMNPLIHSSLLQGWFWH